MLLEAIVFFCGLGALISFLKGCNVFSLKGLIFIPLVMFGLIVMPEMVLGFALLFTIAKAKSKFARSPTAVPSGSPSEARIRVPQYTSNVFDRMRVIAASSAKPVADVIYRNQPPK